MLPGAVVRLYMPVEQIKQAVPAVGALGLVPRYPVHLHVH